MREDGIAAARKHARALQSEVGLCSASRVEIEWIADWLDIRIVAVDFAGALATLVVQGDSTRILLSSRIRDPARRRFAIAHELGHYVLSHPSLTETANEPALGESPGRASGQDHEQEADSFAVELLTPSAIVDAIGAQRTPDLALCAQLATSAALPLEYAALRFVERSTRICAAVLSRVARDVWVAQSEPFRARFAGSFARMLREAMPFDPRKLSLSTGEVRPPGVPADVADAQSLHPVDEPLRGRSSRMDDGSVLTMIYGEHPEGVSEPVRNIAAASYAPSTRASM